MGEERLTERENKEIGRGRSKGEKGERERVTRGTKRKEWDEGIERGIKGVEGAKVLWLLLAKKMFEI